MYTKTKIGDMELIQPDPKIIDMLNVVLSHNEKILQMNSKLIDAFSSIQPILLKKSKEENHRGSTPGE